MSITAALTSHAARLGDRAAVIFEGERMSWRALDSALHRIAGHLARSAAGRPIALHLDNSPALLLLFLAAARSGHEAVILDPAWPAHTRDAVLMKIPDPLLLTSDPGLASRFQGRCIDTASGFASFAAEFKACGPDDRVREPPPSNAFYVGFTSGSTGRPKGYRRTHASWLAGYAAEESEFGITETDIALVPGPMAHSLAPYAIVRGLNSGATVLFCRRFSPKSIWALIRRQRVSIVYGVPTQLRLLLDAAERAASGPAASVRLILSTGSKWPAEDSERLAHAFPSAEFCEFYGTSELGYLTLAKSSEALPPASVGRPFPGVQLSIRDEASAVLGPMRTGRVFVESPLVFTSYAYGAEGTEIRAGQAVSAGDIGYLGEDGLLYLTGRADRMVISAGKNIHPEEVEAALQAHPALCHVAVLEVPDALRGERIIAMVHAQAPTSRAELIRHAASLLSPHKVPRQYVLVSDWPVTQGGKPDFAALRRLLDTGAWEELR